MPTDGLVVPRRYRPGRARFPLFRSQSFATFSQATAVRTQGRVVSCSGIRRFWHRVGRCGVRYPLVTGVNGRDWLQDASLPFGDSFQQRV